ncbi:MAG TPA: hypothetical protein ENJ90_04835 [Devosia sp.]|nr:hypothetical protein [Devosia sp.]
MKTSVWLWGIVETVIWYGFIYYLLYVLKNPVDLWFSSAVLLALVYAGTAACPWVHNSDAWRRMIGKTA